MMENDDSTIEGTLTLLAGGTLGMRVPLGWRLTGETFSGATFLPDSIETAALQIEVASFEDPGAVSRDDFSRFLEEEARSMFSSGELSGNKGFIIKGTWVDESSGSHRQIWRVLKSLFPDHVRIATYTLDVPLSMAAATMTEALADEVELIVESSAFAGGLTTLDRVAPTPDMKRVSLWNLIHMRVPGAWHFVREGEGASGMYRGEPEDEKLRGREAFWIDFEEFRRQADAEAMSRDAQRQVIRELAERVSGQLEAADREPVVEFLGDGDGLLHYQHLRKQGEDDLRISRWFRFAARKESILMVMFTFVANRDGPDDRELTERAEMLDREIRNAVVKDPRTRGDF